ncbi:hypothetical protein BT96DRAFT_995684 [Gymnopus androsaceus JB14]|uniref:Uncharacterized protein n=1 Tax=Gymnopus androsaceus JB14 TaxID=1447944 RepID=A0A6A4HI04_9AGAR|nr:hypothetical protein BT96DRAFT_995684 [Gymnopus androsaceus JB14]
MAPRSSQEISEPETQFIELPDDDIKWDGINPDTGQPWEDSWVFKHDVTNDLVSAWREKHPHSTSTHSSKASRGGSKAFPAKANLTLSSIKYISRPKSESNRELTTEDDEPPKAGPSKSQSKKRKHASNDHDESISVPTGSKKRKTVEPSTSDSDSEEEEVPRLKNLLKGEEKVVQSTQPPPKSIQVPSDPSITHIQLQEFLERLKNIVPDGSHSAAYIHPKVVAWKDRRQRTNAPFVFSEADQGYHFVKSPANWIGKKIPNRVTETGETVSDMREWHFVAVALINCAKMQGKKMLVFDVDAPLVTRKSRSRDFLKPGVVKALWDDCRLGGPADLYVNEMSPYKDQKECLRWACDALVRWAKLGDRQWEGDNDPRAVKMVKIRKI